MAFEFNVTEKGQVLANSHRGYSAKYPENTMPCVCRCVGGRHAQH